MAILETNWTCKYGEVDIVARDGATLVICEVKTRTGTSHGTGLEAVTGRKATRLRRLGRVLVGGPPGPTGGRTHRGRLGLGAAARCSADRTCRGSGLMAATHSVALDGLTGRPIEVEVDINSGMPGTVLVGLGGHDRQRSTRPGTGGSGQFRHGVARPARHDQPGAVERPEDRLTLRPGDRLRAVRRQTGDPGATRSPMPSCWASSRSTGGCARCAASCRRRWRRSPRASQCVFVPESNAIEAGLVPDIEVVGLRSLRQLVAMLTDQPEPDDPPVPPLDESPFSSKRRRRGWTRCRRCRRAGGRAYGDPGRRHRRAPPGDDRAARDRQDDAREATPRAAARPRRPPRRSR